MKYAVIDIGSNTVRLCVYRFRKDKLSLVLNKCVMARLGSKTEEGALTQEGVCAAVDALNSLGEILKKQRVKKTFVFATAALRNIANSAEVIKEIEEKTGFTIDLLSGEMEAKLTYLGAAQYHKITNGVIADIGGGSTELILVKNEKIIKTVSFPIGSLVAFVRFVGKRPATPAQIAEIRSYIRSLLETTFTERVSAEYLYGIGGAVRAAYEIQKTMCISSGGAIAALEMTLRDLQADGEFAEQIISIASPERLDTALPGVAILCEVADFFGCRTLEVCRAGVREGYMEKQLEKLDREGA